MSILYCERCLPKMQVRSVECSFHEFQRNNTNCSGHDLNRSNIAKILDATPIVTLNGGITCPFNDSTSIIIRSAASKLGESIIQAYGTKKRRIRHTLPKR